MSMAFLGFNGLSVDQGSKATAVLALDLDCDVLCTLANLGAL